MLFGHNANGFITTRQDNSRSAVNRFPLLTEFDDFELTFLPFLKLFLSSDELNAQISTGFLCLEMPFHGGQIPCASQYTGKSFFVMKYIDQSFFQIFQTR
jgi:hypothetical protein